MGYGYGNTTYHGSKEARDNDSGARVKSVFDNRMTAHVWAQNSQSFGRSSNGNLYFEGPTLFSYGSHYVVGYVLPDGSALINSDKDSITTGGHVSDATTATRGRYYMVPDLTGLISKTSRFDPDVAKKSAEHHILENAKSYNAESAVAVLIAAGHKPGVKVIELVSKIMRNAERAAAKEKARAEKAEKDSNLSRAKSIAEYTPDDWKARKESWFRHTSFQQNTKTGKITAYGDGARALREMLAAQKAAKESGWSARVKLISARRMGLRADILTMQGKFERGLGNRRFKLSLERVRRYLAHLAEHGALNNAYEYRELSSELGALAGLDSSGAPSYRKAPGVTPAIAARLAALRTQVSAVAEYVTENEARIAEQQRAIRAAEKYRKEKEARESWLAGQPVRWHGADMQGGAMLRAVNVERDDSGAITSGTLETSQGATVPLVHAVKVFRFVRHVMASGAPWHRNGHTIRVGHFTVDRIEPNGTMKAGCHVLHLAEMERVAGLLGLAQIAPDMSALVSTKEVA